VIAMKPITIEKMMMLWIFFMVSPVGQCVHGRRAW
jgi:hypothetical protein